MNIWKIAALGAAAPLHLAVLPGPLPASDPASVLLLPFANSSGGIQAPEIVESALVARLEAKGYRVRRGEDVRSFLESERLRYIDSFSAAEREKMLRRFDAGSILLGTIHSFSEGPNPVVGVSARMLDSAGKTLWSAVSGLTGADTEGALALHRIDAAEPLARTVVSRLCADLPSPGRIAGISGRAHRLGLKSPRTFRSTGLPGGSRHRICQLPLRNASSDRAASRLVGEILSRRLAESPLFEVVEPADFRAAMVKAKLAGLKSGDPAELKKLGAALGTNLFLTGTIYRYRDVSANTSLPPEIELELTLTDAAGGEVVWTSSAARKGTDYAGFFSLGEITNMVTLADQVAAEMIHAVETSRPKASAPAAGGRVANLKETR